MGLQVVVGSESNRVVWGLDDAVTPQLVDRIRVVSELDKISWEETSLWVVVQRVVDSWDVDELLDAIYDEDPAVIAEFAILLKLSGVTFGESEVVLSSSPSEIGNYSLLARLYLPLFAMLIEKMELE